MTNREAPVEMIEEKNKIFARVGWILDYGLRFREEKGWAGGKNKDNFGQGKRHRLKRDED